MKLAGRPTLGGVVGGVIASVGAIEILTVTVPDAWPLGAAGVGVGVPPAGGFAGGAVLVGAVAPTLAVTVATWLVVRVVEAAPSAPAVTSVCDKTPEVVVNDTGEDGSGLPLMSKTFAVTVVVPPVFGTVAGLAFTVTRPTPAVPTEILMAPFVPVVAPPEVARDRRGPVT